MPIDHDVHDFVTAILAMPRENITNLWMGDLLKEISAMSENEQYAHVMQNVIDKMKEITAFLEKHKGFTAEPRTIVLKNTGITLVQFVLPSGSSINVIKYTTAGRKKYILIDTGPGCYIDEIDRSLRKAGIDPEHDITHILATHMDVDHAGALGYFAGHYGIPAYAHPLWEKTINSRLTGNGDDWRYQLSKTYTKLFWSWFKGVPPEKTQITAIDPGNDIPGLPAGLSIIPESLPGHTADSVCYCVKFNNETIAIVTGCHARNTSSFTEETKEFFEGYGPHLHGMSTNADSELFREENKKLWERAAEGGIMIVPGHGLPYHRTKEASITIEKNSVNVLHSA